MDSVSKNTEAMGRLSNVGFKDFMGVILQVTKSFSEVMIVPEPGMRWFIQNGYKL